MTTIGQILYDASSVAVRYSKRLTNDVPAQQFGRFASPGGVIVHSNHPAFVVGHLALYPEKALKLLGIEPTAAKPSDQLVQLFSKDMACVDDPEGKIYPAKDVLLEFFTQAYEEARTAIRDTSDATLKQPTADDSPMKTLFPTVGAMLAFYMDGHVLMHMGQVSAWRRMQGMQPA
jgi:hypothetical protein